MKSDKTDNLLEDHKETIIDVKNEHIEFIEKQNRELRKELEQLKEKELKQQKKETKAFSINVNAVDKEDFIERLTNANFTTGITDSNDCFVDKAIEEGTLPGEEKEISTERLVNELKERKGVRLEEVPVEGILDMTICEELKNGGYRDIDLLLEGGPAKILIVTD